MPQKKDLLRKIYSNQRTYAVDWEDRKVVINVHKLLDSWDMDKMQSYASKTDALWLAFKNAETEEAIYVIYKVGDELRQDVLVIQLI